jgi:membrane-bound serine protease (ClpP class)
MLASAQVTLYLLEGEVNSFVTLSIQKAIYTAEIQGSNALIIEINTLGGNLKDALAIRKALDKTSLKTIAYINSNAASAGAIIAFSCQKVYMNPSASVGAATPIHADGSPASEKVNSYVRSLLRASAEKFSRNSEEAEKMVGQSQNGYQVSSLTASEAIKKGLADGLVNDIIDILDKENMNSSKISPYQSGWQELVMSFVLKPWVSFMLLVLMILGIKWEMALPGFGFAGVLGLLSGLLFFIPHQVYGLAEYWEIGLFCIGILLVALEIFVVPGFGITGISGLIAIGTAIGLSVLPNEGFVFQAVEPSDIVEVSAYITLGMIALTIGFLWLLPKLLQSRALGEISLHSSMDKDEGYTSDFKTLDLLGQEGIAQTVLRPSGKIMIKNKIYEAIAEGDYLEKGTAVLVIENSGNLLKVRRLK